MTKSNETSLSEKEEFYCNLNMENITDAGYMHAKGVCKGFEIKHLGKYHDLYLKSDTLFLDDVFKNVRYHLDPVKFCFSSSKKTEIKLEVLSDIDMLLMVEKRIRGGICHASYRHAKADNKYMKNYNKNKESSYHKYWDVINLYGCKKASSK